MPIDCPSSEAKHIDLVEAANGQEILPNDLGYGPVRGPAAHQYKSVVQCLTCRHSAEPDPVALPGRLPAATASANANKTFPFV